ncbi:MAG: hypothetical protein KDD67_11825 [Ignavibacteriae bacterium]|nr:hypothetical protein [Ignavibacteriota bacterium]MCB9214938.1 hypothetical protein [Ignavibacteria bacterium]
MTATKQKNWREHVVVVIAVLTIVAGGGQALLSSTALSTMGIANPDSSTRLFFLLLSLLILLFGMLLLSEGLRPSADRRVLFWTGVQKLVAALVLLVGVIEQTLLSAVVGVVIYDGLCGLFLLLHWFRFRRTLNTA